MTTPICEIIFPQSERVQSGWAFRTLSNARCDVLMERGLEVTVTKLRLSNHGEMERWAYECGERERKQ